MGEDLAVLDRAIGEATLDSPVVRRLLTVTGINVTVAAGLAAAIGDVLCNDNFDVLRASITMAARDVSVWAGAGVGGHWV
ncbi:hypothetical protein ADL19_08885, partial [Streptomyces purpurogeneiscleroticus]